MRQPVEPGCAGPYVQANEALDRARDLSREELRKLLDETPEDGIGPSSSGDVSGNSVSL